MDYNDASPKYQMELIKKVEETLWGLFDESKYDNVRFYIEKWHKQEGLWENFTIFLRKNTDNIDLKTTLHQIPFDILVKIAIDLEIDTPDFLPCIPTFKNTLKTDYKSAHDIFQRAVKEVEENPSLAVGYVNSALESIMKNILKDDRFRDVYCEQDTTYSLAQKLLKKMGMYPGKNMPEEVRTIGSSLLSACQGIERMRSTKTVYHGKADDEEIINDPKYAYFIVNAVTTIGLFLDTEYKKSFPLPPKNPFVNDKMEDDSLPF